MSLSRRALLGAGSGIVLAGCTAPVASAPGSPSTAASTAPVTPATAAASVSADPAAVAAAVALVRSGVALPGEPVASLKITEGSQKGGAIHVWEVRSTASSCVLTWAMTVPDGRGNPGSDRDRPTLRVGDTVYRVSQSKRFEKNWIPITTPQGMPSSEPIAGYALYAPLPDDVIEVTVGVDSSKDTAKLTVQRGPVPPPAGTPDIPILGRVFTRPRTDPKQQIPMIITIHGVRRIQGATALYMSLAGQATTDTADPATWLVSDGIFNQYVGSSFGFYHSTHLVDHPGLMGWTGTSGVLDAPNLSALYASVMKAGNAGVTIVILPPLPDGLTEVDAIIAGQYFYSLPVQDGPMTPVSAEKYVALGAGWPAVNPKEVANVTPEKIAAYSATMRDNATTKSITKTGGGNLELEADVLFDYNKATLTSEAAGIITRAVSDIKAAGRTGQLTITGHTDSDGSPAYNLTLSKARAQTVATALGKQLPASYTYRIVGKGEAEPIADNTTKSGRARNRRVAITLPGR